MTEFTVTIVGTGVIGTSMGLALKQHKEPIRVLGHDKDLLRAKEGVKMGAFDRAEWNLVNACEKADLIVLAIPLSGIRFTLEAIAKDLKQGVVITDTTPNKVDTLAWAQELLPEHAHFVGGNPIVQPAGTGYEHASADLFRGRLYCLTPAATANETAVETMLALVSLLGAAPFFLDPAEHDGLMAAVEHLPAMLSVALVNTLLEQGAWNEGRKLAGSLFEHVSAGAVGDPDALKEAWLSQQTNLPRLVDALIRQLTALRDLLVAEDGGEPLAQAIDRAVVERASWQKDVREGKFIGPEVTTPPLEKQGLFKRLFGIRR